MCPSAGWAPASYSMKETPMITPTSYEETKEILETYSGDAITAAGKLCKVVAILDSLPDEDKTEPRLAQLLHCAVKDEMVQEVIDRLQNVVEALCTVQAHLEGEQSETL